MEPYDLVITAGHVIDPETGLGTVCNVGIKGDRIASISEGPLQGTKTLKANSMVVAPGDISLVDLHHNLQ